MLVPPPFFILFCITEPGLKVHTIPGINLCRMFV